MNRPELYQKTINLLVEAYFSDKLRHGDCSACAVGNILKEYIERIDISPYSWAKLFLTTGWRNGPTTQYISGVDKDEVVVATIYPSPRMGVYQIDEVYEDEDGKDMVRLEKMKALDAIKMSGYTVAELARVEKEFETASKDGDWMFNGLMAVVDVLDEIHEAGDEITITSKSKFHGKVPVMV